jgi:hypothetical protein
MGNVSASILDPGARCGRAAILMLWQPYFLGKGSQCKVDVGQVGFKVGLDAAKREISHLCQESNPGCPACSSYVAPSLLTCRQGREDIEALGQCSCYCSCREVTAVSVSLSPYRSVHILHRSVHARHFCEVCISTDIESFQLIPYCKHIASVYRRIVAYQFY